MSVPGAVGTFIANLMTKPSKGFSDGMNIYGDFDVDGFINSNLERAKGTPGTKLPQVIQGLTRAVGLGPKHLIGTPQESQLTDQWFKDLKLGGDA